MASPSRVAADFLRRGILLDGQIRIAHTVTTALAAEAVRIHNLEPVAAHCLARAITCGALVSPLLGEDERATLRWEYDGALRSIMVETGPDADLRGAIQPADLHQADNPVLLYGEGGRVALIRSDPRGKRSSVSEASLLDITEDLGFYFATSDQVETEILVLVAFNADPENPVALCQGVLLQAMPGCDLEQFEAIRQGLRSPQTRELLGQVATTEALIDSLPLAANSAHELHDGPTPHFHCGCSRERTLSMLELLPEADRAELREQDEPTVVVCHFCATRYEFQPREIPA
jgi:molecular chaperone Hsp33